VRASTVLKVLSIFSVTDHSSVQFLLPSIQPSLYLCALPFTALRRDSLVSMHFNSSIALTLCALLATVTSLPTPQLLSPSAGKDISNLKIQNAKALEKDEGVSRRRVLLHRWLGTKDIS
jgi:hypothetical protein